MHAALIPLLPAPPRATNVAQTQTPAPGRVIPFAPYARRLAELRYEDAAQVEWNRLPALVAEAWSWRDPESIAAVEACVTRLKSFVLEEWDVD